MMLYLKVKPNQRFDRVSKVPEAVGNSVWELRLKAPAIEGKANEHLVEYLAEILDLPKTKIVLRKGQTSKIKCLEIQADEIHVINKLEEALHR
jgi:uncharacterized protein (TIGR00251 family)